MAASPLHQSKGESLLAGLKKKGLAKEILRVSRSFPFPPVDAEPRHMFIIWMAIVLTWVGDPKMTKNLITWMSKSSSVHVPGKPSA